MGIVSGGVAVPLDVHPVDEAFGVLSKQLLREPVVLGHRGGTTVMLPFISFSGALRLYCIVLNSVPVAPVKAELDAPRSVHVEAVAPVALLGEVGIEMLGHYKISFCSKYMNKNTSGKAPEARLKDKL